MSYESMLLKKYYSILTRNHSIVIDEAKCMFDLFAAKFIFDNMSEEQKNAFITSSNESFSHALNFMNNNLIHEIDIRSFTCIFIDNIQSLKNTDFYWALQRFDFVRHLSKTFYSNKKSICNY